MKKLAVILAVIIAFSGMDLLRGASVYAATTPPPEIVAESGILIDGNTGQILYNKNMNAQLEPASTTKMITCLLALENLKLNQVMTIDAETPFTEGSRIYLLEGENITVENVLYALMLDSANDAAVALAKEVAGSVEDFAVMMNKRAKEMGAKNTNFVNPNGLHIEEHLSTAYDLAMIAKGCMKNEMFRKFVTTYYHHIDATNKQDQRYLYNTNRLLYDVKTQVSANGVLREAKYEGCVGIKTGYTSKAGGCLVAGAKRNGTYLIAVVLKSTDLGRFGDCIALFDYGFANYHSKMAIKAGENMGRIKIKKGSPNKLTAVTKEDAYVTLPSEASSAVIKTKVILDKDVKAPIKKGQKVGTVEVYESDVLAGEVDLITTGASEEGTLLSYIGIGNKAAYIIYIIGGILLVIAAALIIAYNVLRRRQAKRQRELREMRAAQIAREREAKLKDCNKRDWHF